jgi:hypothetical protein
MKRQKRIMPFGKHKDKSLRSVPRGYLVWAMKNCTLDENLRRDIQAVLYDEPYQATDDELLDEVFAKYWK